MGDAMVCRRERALVGGTKNWAVFIMASRSVVWVALMIKSGTGTATRAMDWKYVGGGLGDA